MNATRSNVSQISPRAGSTPADARRTLVVRECSRTRPGSCWIPGRVSPSSVRRTSTAKSASSNDGAPYRSLGVKSHWAAPACPSDVGSVIASRDDAFEPARPARGSIGGIEVAPGRKNRRIAPIRSAYILNFVIRIYVGRMLREIAMKLDDWMAARNIEAREGGWAQLHPCTGKVLGQRSP